MNLDNIQQTKDTLIQAIKAMVKPHLHESGYVTGGWEPGKSKSVWLYHFGHHENGDAITIKFEYEEFEGFTSDGIISNIFCALATQSYDSMYLEQLIELFEITKNIKFKQGD